MKHSTIITIERDGSEDLTVEVTGTHKDGWYSSRECGLPTSPDEPERFEDIEAVVVEDVRHAEHENLLTFKAGEVIQLTRTEEELAEQALLKAWKNDI